MMQWSHSLAEKKPRALLDSTLDEADFRGECSLPCGGEIFAFYLAHQSWTELEKHPVNLNGFSLRAAGAILGNVVGLKAIFHHLKIGAKKPSSEINSSKNGNSCHVLLLLERYYSTCIGL